MKKTLTTLFILTLVFVGFAQIPSGYYNSATGTGSTLKTQLFNIIKNPSVTSYAGLWTAFQTTDVDNYYENDGSVMDIYSENPTGTDPYNYSYTADQCGNYSGENSCYNREHSFPKSWFNDATPMYSDLFHLYPTDGYVNGRRSNYPYGEVTSPTWTSQNGSKLGPCTYPGYSGTVFEPIDEFKGDLARSYFYMATCYEDKIASWETNTSNSDAVLNGTSYPCYETWFLDMLLEWNDSDPVSQKEIDRNNAVYNIQDNRNPYIDHPEYVNRVFDPTNAISEKIESQISIYPNPVTNNYFTVKSNNSKEKSLIIFNADGRIMKTEDFSEQEKNINITNLQTGFYLIKITSENKTNWEKIIVK